MSKRKSKWDFLGSWGDWGKDDWDDSPASGGSYKGWKSSWSTWQPAKPLGAARTDGAYNTHSAAAMARNVFASMGVGAAVQIQDGCDAAKERRDNRARRGDSGRKADGTVVLPPPNGAHDRPWHGVADHEAGLHKYPIYPAKALPLTEGEKHVYDVLRDIRGDMRVCKDFPGAAINLGAAYRARRDAMIESGEFSELAERPAANALAAVMAKLCRPAEGLAGYLAENETRQKAEDWAQANGGKVVGAYRHDDLMPLAQELARIINVEQDGQMSGRSGEGQEGQGEGEQDAEQSGQDGQQGEGQAKPKKAKAKPGDKPDPRAGLPRIGVEQLQDAQEQDGEGQPEGANGEDPDDTMPWHWHAGPKHPVQPGVVNTPQAKQLLAYGTHGANVSRCMLEVARPVASKVGSGLGRLRDALTADSRSRYTEDLEEGNAISEDALAQLALKRPIARPYADLTLGRAVDTVVAVYVDGSGSMECWPFARAMGAAYALARGLAGIPGVRSVGFVNADGSRLAGGSQKSARAILGVLWHLGQCPGPSKLADWCEMHGTGGTEFWTSATLHASGYMTALKASRRIALFVTDGGLTGSDPETLNSELASARELGVEAFLLTWGEDAITYCKPHVNPAFMLAAPDMAEPSRQWAQHVVKLLMPKGASSAMSAGGARR